MDLLNKDFFNCLINFDTFSRLPKNTDIHLSKTGYFVPTAGKLSGIMGAQTISNLYNGYHGDQLIMDLESFFNHLISIMGQMIDISHDKTIKYETACKVKILNRNYKYAAGNDEKGLICLLNTNPLYYDQLNNLMLNFKNKLEAFKTITSDWIIDDKILPFCPESSFTDDDWDYYLINSRKFQYETIGFYKYYMQYSTSLFYNQMMNYAYVWHWYDLIYDDKVQIYLGGMPLKSCYSLENRNDLLTIKNLNIGAVLSVVECYENLSTALINTPITPTEWHEHDIKFLQLPICDFQNIPLDKVQVCVEYIHWNIINRRSIYISCRVGKSRSSYVLMCYMVKYLKFSAIEAYEYIKNKRVQIQNKHFKSLEIYESLIHNLSPQ